MVKSHILGYDGVWYSSFWSEGSGNHLNWQNLVKNFVLWGFYPSPKLIFRMICWYSCSEFAISIPNVLLCLYPSKPTPQTSKEIKTLFLNLVTIFVPTSLSRKRKENEQEFEVKIVQIGHFVNLWLIVWGLVEWSGFLAGLTYPQNRGSHHLAYTRQLYWLLERDTLSIVASRKIHHYLPCITWY